MFQVNDIFVIYYTGNLQNSYLLVNVLLRLRMSQNKLVNYLPKVEPFLNIMNLLNVLKVPLTQENLRAICKNSKLFYLNILPGQPGPCFNENERVLSLSPILCDHYEQKYPEQLIYLVPCALFANPYL